VSKRPSSTPAARRIALGDFQTPPTLASGVCRRLAATLRHPVASIVEPTCGTGNLLVAALEAFPACERALGIEIRAAEVRALRAELRRRGLAARARVETSSFFDVAWATRLAALPPPILVIGNPPWVTNADLGALRSDNLPTKANLDGLPGIAALTGKSNFDISEWMLRALLAALDGRDATLAMLCKASVARKVLAAAWTAGHRIATAATYRVDAARWFGASVEACLLVCELGRRAGPPRCARFSDLDAATPDGAFGMHDGVLVSDVERFERSKHLLGESTHAWRSGIKHDCAAVVELRPAGAGRYDNGDGERVRLEPDLVFPMLKGAELARGVVRPSRCMLVTQRRVGEDTAPIANRAPRTWRYLLAHRARFERRASRVYRGKPPFSMFGIGDYAFAPWKVAIAGLSKRIAFRVVGPHEGKPVVLDDTCYFVACASRAEARAMCRRMSSPPVIELLSSLVFRDAKRPVTAEMLRRIDASKLTARP